MKGREDIMAGNGQAGRRGLLALAGLGTALAAREALARLREADLRGQVALITGGSRGLGLLLARELAREGCAVAICARDPDELERARQGLEADGARVVAVRCDVADRDAVARMVQEVTGQLGRVDVLVNNAGIIQVGPVQAMTADDFEQACAVMYWGVVYPTLAVLPQMRERHYGRIVTITSIGGKVAVPHLLPYTAAKFAAVGFSEGLRAEVTREGVVVTTIVPGLMRTGSYVNALFKGRRPREFTWFGLGASLPFVSMDAERAARQIVRATKRGEAERTLTVPATLLAAFHGLFPGTTTQVMRLANRLILPPAEATTAAVPGRVIQEESPSRVREALTVWGRSSAERFHEYPGPTSTGNGAAAQPGRA
jgi:NAD(P)-dependent dehydrogenase (short-subunit alcohol dehydrogenase family)